MKNDLLLLTAIAVLAFPNLNFAQTAPNLGVASPFALFTGTGAFNGDVGTSTLGDIGTNAGLFTYPGTLVGTAHVMDAVSAQAATDVTAAFTALNVNNACGVVLGTPFGNQTLGPNVYCLGGASVLTGTLTLDGGGNPNAVFIFKVGGALSTDDLSNITLINGASFCNVYFRVNGAVALGSSSVFRGTIVANGAISLGVGATLIGRGLATVGAISTNSNVVQLLPACVNPAPPVVTCPADAIVSCASQVPAANPASVTVFSTCPGAIAVIALPDVISNQTCPNRYTISRTYQVTDNCGNMVSCTQTITVNDQTAPSITCPAAVTVPCGGQVPPGSNTAAGTNDNCGGGPVTVTFNDVISNQTCPNRFTLTRTYTGTDACGNAGTCDQIITVDDQTPPTITCPSMVSVSCIPPADPASVMTMDNCPGLVTVTSSDALSNQRCANGLTITRTYTATDVCGNAAMCNQTITVNDVTPPTVTTGAIAACYPTVAAAEAAALLATTGTDNCGGAVTETVATVGTCSATITVTVTDGCGNPATAVYNTRIDNTSPTVVTGTIAACYPTVAAAEAAALLATTETDNCPGALTEVAATVGTCSATITVTVMDGCGNTGTAIYMTRIDGTPPAVVTGAIAACYPTVAAAEAAALLATTATDNCPGPLTETAATVASTNVACGFIITVTVRDGCNMATAVYNTRIDGTPPTVVTGTIAACYPTVAAAEAAALLATTETDNCPGPLTETAATVGTCSATITVTVMDGCNMSVAIYATRIDGTPPTVVTGIIAACYPSVAAAEAAALLATTATDNCPGPLTQVATTVAATNLACGFTITVTVTDGCGNAAMAVYTTRIDGSSPGIICPVNLMVPCAGQVPAANINTVITNDNCGTVTVTSTDVVTNQTCPNRFTLTRTYTSTDPCGNATMCAQIITVNDQVLPVIACPANVTVSCASQIPAADPVSIIASDNCGPATVTFVSDVVMGMTCTNRFSIARTYRATDLCGNSSVCTQIITVNDQTPPVFTVLPQDLQVECAEGVNYEVELNAWLANFGNAQVSDGCGAASLTAVALISEAPLCGDNTPVRTYEFRATDACGNTSSARAKFSIVDITPPVIICPPGSVLLTCVHDIPAPNLADVVAYDNCGSVNVTVTVSTVGTGCLDYPMTINYWFMATDECGNMSNCDQSFQLIDSLPPIYAGPDTIEVGCVNDLPGSGEIRSILAPYLSDNCSDVVCVGRISTQNGANSITYTVKAKDLCENWTERFSVTFIATGICQPLCTATQMTWGDPAGVINGMATTAAIDQFMAEHGGVTAGKFVKTITATSTACVLAMLPGSGTTGQITLGKHTFGTDNNCNPASPLLNNNGTLKNELAANVMAMQFNIWYNQAFNQRSLGVQPLAGLPACLVDPIVLEKMETDLVTVQGLLNLSNTYLVGVGFYPPGFGELLNNALENLNNYWQNCQINDPCPVNATVAGALKTELQSGVEEVTINLVGSHPTSSSISIFALTDGQGAYTFPNAIPQSSNLTVTPMKDDNPLNGVSTYDLALISKHILGLEPLNSPYKMIAADANKSGSITAFDIVELRKLILGIYEELPNNTSWRFVDKSFTFPTMANPFQADFPENITRANIVASKWNEDFVALKVGDVNQSAIANAQQSADDRTSGTLLLDVDFGPRSTQGKENNGMVEDGETFEVTFKTVEAAQGFQFTLNLDGLSVVEIVGNEKVTAENFAVFLPTGAGTKESGALTVSVDGAQEFTVRFRATRAGRISNMLSVSSRITKAEGYITENNHIVVKEVALRFHENGTSVIAGVDFELYQNQPNPFQNRTVIGFYLPTAAVATLTLYDDSGRTIFTQQGDFAKGYNSIPVELSMLNNSSMLYYKLQTPTNVATKKMIQVK